jgi:hypothetical protein
VLDRSGYFYFNLGALRFEALPTIETSSTQLPNPPVNRNPELTETDLDLAKRRLVVSQNEQLGNYFHFP